MDFGLVHFSTRTDEIHGKSLPENMDLTPSRWTLQFSSDWWQRPCGGRDVVALALPLVDFHHVVHGHDVH